MPAYFLSIISLVWGYVISTLAFLAAHASLGAWIQRPASQLVRKLRSWGFKWPETPAPPDCEELRDTLIQIRVLLEQNSQESQVMSELLREMGDQGTNHHSEIREHQSTELDLLVQISSDAHEITGVLNTLRVDVHVVVASEMDRLLQRLPQLIREAESEARPRHQRAASA